VSARAEAEPIVVAPREPARMLRFCLVGLANSAVALAAFTILVALGCPAAVASALAFATGAVNSFLCNSRWTFNDLAPAPRAWWRFAALQGIGALASGAGVGTLVSHNWAHLTAECVILPCVTATLYALSRLLVFRAPAS
jgi:putative flippase GtrA